MRNSVLIMALGAAIAPSAFQSLAQEVSVDAGATVVASAMDREGEGGDSSLLFDAFVGLEVDHVFDSGLEIGGALEVRAQKDTASRPGFAASYPTPYPRIGPAPSSGLMLGLDTSDVDLTTGMERAYVYLKSGWGEVSAGRDVGVAVRLDARPPTINSMASATSPRLDPNGAAFVRARNDVTGPSAKVSVVSSRLVGFKAGVSFTPTADARGVDFYNTSARSPDGAQLENVAEAALSFSYRFRSSGLKVRAGLTGVWADSSENRSVFGSYEAYGAGFELDKDDWSGGVRWLNSNNAVRTGQADYSAFEAGVVRKLGDWRIGLEYGRATDDFLGLEGESTAVGVSKKVNDSFEIGLSYLDSHTKWRESPLLAPNGQISSGNGVLVEMSVRK